ncbi:MAG TPA: glutathione synthase [Polyangia bacterium]|jgi:glutathione synthase|nr:glutathione synthase [Polyangia bacterium]
MRLFVVMDPPESLQRRTDTTLAVIEEALRRGHAVDVATPADLWLDGGELEARWRRACLPPAGASSQVPPPGLCVGEAVTSGRVAEYFDLVLMRKDPPYDMEYHLATLLLEQLRGKVRVVNDPRGLREANEKLFILRFPELIPATVVSRDRDFLFEFMRRQGGEMIVKPLDGYGGAGVLHLQEDDRNNRSLLELMTQGGRRAVMAQRYLPAARQGDKRILLLGGEGLGAVLRVPRPDETRANFHAGGSPARTLIEPSELKIIETLRPALAELGLDLVGIDVIGGHLTEVNVTSPTGVLEINQLEGTRLEARIVDWLERAQA